MKHEAKAVREAAQPYTENFFKKTKDAYNSFTDGDWTFYDYISREDMEAKVLSMIEKLKQTKEYAKSNVDIDDVGVILDFISNFIPGGTLVREGGRIMFRFYRNSQDITEHVQKIRKSYKDGENKEAAKQVYQLIKEILNVKKLWEQIRRK